VGASLFDVSTGNVTDEIIAEYIQNQDEVERRKKNRQLFSGLLA
jgi:hypothetical protein